MGNVRTGFAQQRDILLFVGMPLPYSGAQTNTNCHSNLKKNAGGLPQGGRR